MKHIVRVEQIDDDLMLRVPAELAAELGWSVGDEKLLSGVGARLQADPMTADDDQLSIGRKVAQRHREALARLAR